MGSWIYLLIRLCLLPKKDNHIFQIILDEFRGNEEINKNNGSDVIDAQDDENKTKVVELRVSMGETSGIKGIKVKGQ